MPLFYQHNINDNTQLAVWHIREDENFFLEKVQLQKKINHPHKRLQHLAGRYLLQLLDPAFPVQAIEIAASNKPLLTDNSLHFSISHCGNYAGAIVSNTKRVGIDLEIVTPKINFIRHKFLSEKELRLLPSVSNTLLTILWSCKEAVYKWYGHGGVDFKAHIHIDEVSMQEHGGVIQCKFLKDETENLTLYCKLFNKICLTWVEQ